MKTLTELDEQITAYLSRLNTDQKKAVLTVVKTFAKEKDDWDDDDFLEELDRRTTEYELGKAKLYTLEEIEARARYSRKDSD